MVPLVGKNKRPRGMVQSLQSLLVSKETWASFLPKVIAIVSVCEGEPSYVVPVFSSTFFSRAVALLFNWKYFRAEISPQTTCR